MRLFWGDKAEHIAVQAHNTSSRNKWLRETLDKMIKIINDLDTTSQHQKSLMSEIDILKKKLSRAKQPSWNLVFHFFSLCGRLLGFDFISGSRVNTPVYLQSQPKYREDYYSEKNAISVKKRVIKELQKEGLSDFKIGLILNISEYKVKKLRRD